MSLNCVCHSFFFATLEQIDPLIVEINLIPCYDMIEQFCERIMNQLPTLQKQRYPSTYFSYLHLLISTTLRSRIVIIPLMPFLCLD